MLDEARRGALRLFNGFLEGLPGLAVDLYARTLLIFNHFDPPEAGGEAVQAALDFYREALPWLQAAVLKARRTADLTARRGALTWGIKPDRRIREHGVWYALDLTAQQDAGFYLDTRALRLWAIQNLAGKSALNAFAYTGSLGVAARAGGATRVLHLDLKREYLNQAKASYALNGFPVQRGDFLSGDFWTQVNRLKRAGARFDCAFLDPPFFSQTAGGVVDWAAQAERVINKVRPLIAGGGWLAVVNNALYLPGAQFLSSLEALCADGYLSIETLLPVPQDCTGFPHTVRAAPPANPAPFNHSTKIALLRVRLSG
ncbi:MAG: class I SAM-dependent methyltransferase [Chloroflexi bacterium]|nr:class I SAM-dependent methyltransferase [Chloroflexota bacterium]